MKHLFQSLVQGRPGRVTTSRFYGVNAVGFAYGKYDWLVMTLQSDASYCIQGYYAIRDAIFDNTVATGLSLDEGLKLLRMFEDTMMKKSDFDEPGAKPASMFDTVLTRDDFLKKRGRNHIDFIGPKYGVRPPQPVNAARLARLRKANQATVMD